jgi:hypothetical protein
MSLLSVNWLVSRIEKNSVCSAVLTDWISMIRVILRRYRVKDKCCIVLTNHHLYCKRYETKLTLRIKAPLCLTLHQLVAAHVNTQWISGMSNSFPSSTFCQGIFSVIYKTLTWRAANKQLHSRVKHASQTLRSERTYCLFYCLWKHSHKAYFCSKYFVANENFKANLRVCWTDCEVQRQ